MKNIHQLITETVPVFFFTINTKTHLIEYVSPQFYDFVKNKEELEALGPHEKMRSVIIERDQEKFDQFFEDLSKSNKFESSVELRTNPLFCRVDWFELNTFQPAKETSTEKIVGHIVDISEKKNHYEILRKENESIENVMIMMAHDLKSPLSNISLIAKVMEEMMTREEAEKFDKYLNMLRSISRDSSRLIDKLLFLATLKGETSKLDLDLHDLRFTIRAVVESMQELFESRNIKIIYHFPDYSVEALLDSELFKQVIFNLINNAMKFTPDNGEISFSLKYLRNEKSIEISIRDNGIGIPEEHLENLFEGISRIRRKGLKGEESTGLGLYICKQIISIHKGRICAERNQKEGTTFKIFLPIPKASSAYF